MHPTRRSRQLINRSNSFSPSLPLLFFSFALSLPCRVEQHERQPGQPGEQLQQRTRFVAGGTVAPPIGRRAESANLCGTATAVGIQRPGGLRRLLASHQHGHQFAKPAELRAAVAAGSAAAAAVAASATATTGAA